MRYCVWLWIILGASQALAQGCITYVVVNAFDRTNHLEINGLTADDFEIKLAGDSLQIASSAQNFAGRVLVMVQGPGSEDDPTIPEVARNVAEMARQAPPDRPVAFALFGERVIFTKGFSTGWGERRAAVEEVMAQINTLGKSPAVYDALHEGLQFFGPPQPGDTIVLVGTGHDIKSKKNDRDLESEFIEHNARLLATVFVKKSIEGLNHRLETKKYEEVIAWHRLATITGGAYTHGLSPTMVDFAWAGYLLGIKMPSGSDKPKSWKLQLRGPAAKAHKDALIFQPLKVAPCSSAAAATR